MRSKFERGRRAAGLALASGMIWLAAPSMAEAQSRGSRTYESQRAQKGFEGWVSNGRRTFYCSYWRAPNRTCDRGGCRVTSWTLHQSCY